MRAYAGRQFVPFLWWSLVWPGREANSRPTVREADTLPTEPTRHGTTIMYRLAHIWANFLYCTSCYIQIEFLTIMWPFLDVDLFVRLAVLQHPEPPPPTIHGPVHMLCMFEWCNMKHRTADLYKRSFAICYSSNNLFWNTKDVHETFAEQNKIIQQFWYLHYNGMAVGTGGGQDGGQLPPPPFCQPKKLKV